MLSMMIANPDMEQRGRLMAILGSRGIHKATNGRCDSPSSVKPALKATSLPCMAELYQGNAQILTTILRQAEHGA